MLNRREFVSLLGAASLSINERSAFAAKRESSPENATRALHQEGGFPAGDYTPFGYLDNPWHTWNMHPSGVLRSLSGIGFGLYYPAGPGGYFDYHRNGVYAAELAVAYRRAHFDGIERLRAGTTRRETPHQELACLCL
jgi:hypothetical protein